MTGPPLRFSVVMPTYQRRDVVVSSVRALLQQEFDGSFEVVVVVDGSSDGTAAALRALTTPFPLTVIEQPNRGAAAARNRGAAAARGEILLFLDDDMEAHPRLLAEHDASHRQGAEAVLGHLPLHPASPRTFLSAAVESWGARRTQRLSAPGATLTLYDLLTGQLSVGRALFHRLGGFDDDFTRDGAFGGEDVDFGCRLLDGGHRVVFNPAAVSWQYYVVTPRAYLRQWRQAGESDVVFARKHPDQAAAIFGLHRADAFWNRWVWRPLVAVPLLSGAVTRAVRRAALALAAWRPESHRVGVLFRRARDLEYWGGVHAAGGIPRPRPLRVLAYHAISDLAGAPVVEPYGVPPDAFRAHIETLQRAGYRFVAPGEVVRFLAGRGGLPRRSILLTFDDCYADLVRSALPILAERRIPAVAFAVSGAVGGTNAWDAAIGAPELRLADAEGLRTLAHAGVEIGAHSRTHPQLTRVPLADLPGETTGALADLERLGLRRPRMFAYPYGAHDARVREAVARAGVQAAFTVEPGRVRPGHDPLRLPRVEILRADRGARLLWKVALMRSIAPPRPLQPVRRAVRAAARRFRRVARTAG